MLFTTAHAQTADSAPQGGFFVQMLPLLLILVVFYFLLIRPQQKRNKEHRHMLEALATGDEVVTGSGIVGTVTDLEEHFVTLNLGDSKVRFQKSAIQSILPKGTLQAK